jgi:hypothetical protein
MVDTAQNAARINGQFAPGASGCPSGSRSRKDRQKVILADLLHDLGGADALTPIDALLAERAADLLSRRPLSDSDHVRCTNTAARLIAMIRQRQAEQREPAKPSGLASYLSSLKAAP